MEIICTGDIISSDYAKVNLSPIFSFLIKEVGQKVKQYQSDLFYDLRRLDTRVNSCRETNMLIGLREMGVDSTQMVRERLNNPNVYGNPYINIYAIDTKFEDDEVTVVLSTVR